MSDVRKCAKCGQVHTRCSAHRRRPKGSTDPLQPCGRIPAKGSKVCRNHGGLTPGGLAVAAVNNEMERRATLGQPIKIDPISGLLDLIYWSAGHVAWLRERVQATSPNELVWGTTEYSEKIGGDDHGTKTTEKATHNMWLKLYNEERDRLANFCSLAAKNNIEQKRIDLAEKFGSQLLAVIDRIAENIRSALVRLGWDEAELEEVWPEMVAEVIPDALGQIESENEQDRT